MDCLIPILKFDESDFTQSAWIGVLFQILENTCGVICACAPMIAAYATKLGNTPLATSIRHFITTNLSRISQASGGSGNSRRSGRSTRSAPASGSVRNHTIGSWRVNQIKKESTFGVSAYQTDGDSLENLAEASGNHAESGGVSVDIEMDRLPKGNSRAEP